MPETNRGHNGPPLLHNVIQKLALHRVNRCIKSLISEPRNLTIVEYKDQTPEVYDSQMWKKEGNHLISKYDGNMLGVHETKGLVTLSEDDEMITPILIDENATSSFELSLSCM